MNYLRQSYILSRVRVESIPSLSRLVHVSYYSFTTTTKTNNNNDRSSMQTMSKKDFRYSVDLVQNRDRESYLCGLLMPYNSRRSYFAIRAWNIELASIKDSNMHNRINSSSKQQESSTAGGGSGTDIALQVRMQWWREALDRIYTSDEIHNHNNKNLDNGTDPSPYGHFSISDTLDASYFKNPIVRLLDYAVHQKKLTRRFLERLSEAREMDIHHQQPETVEEMIEHADNIVSSLLYLSLETADVRDESADVVAQYAGIGIGLITALRGVRIRLARGECPIPKEFFPQHYPYHKLTYTNNNIDFKTDDIFPTTSNDGKQDMLNSKEREMLQDAVERVCVLAYSHLLKAQNLQSDIPRHARTCFLPVIPALHYLSKLENAKYDIFDERLLEHDNLKILALLARTWLTGVF